ncbi:3'-5' RNA helicase YTHDC2 isoform X2 [Lepeophtheirus salmonis]|uniref:3'-5' RNA helicase YTHDC2 isoform X2 n=1 Tax=Lepeophtheirus salmonis TaxID=72036 RepID=UPI001AE88EE2|nr:3'-5' RNA helicase YTHDC2-like isoform X2 [Lepeophtheirus salmonis]
MPRRKQKVSSDDIDESTCIAVHLTLKKFKSKEEEKEYSFPSSLNKNEKKYIRQLVLNMGLECKNEFKDQSRVLTIFKKEETSIMEQDVFLDISIESQKLLKEVLNQFPLTERERQDLTPLSEREKNPYIPFETRVYSRTVSKLKSSVPLIPPKPSPLKRENQSYIQETTQKLPIHNFKDLIMSSIDTHQVCLVTGPTGCGKTTQIPQYLLECASDTQNHVRIVCTEPRRFAVLSTAERVALERGESLGTTVGYQIRLESMTSPKTALYFCTIGILLRSLMGDIESFLHSLTHIILDEVHERSVQTDFLLTVLREYLHKFPNIKLILISASTEIDLLTDYFPGLQIVEIQHERYPVKEMYLEEILQELNYLSPKMKSYINSMNRKTEDNVSDKDGYDENNYLESKEDSEDDDSNLYPSSELKQKIDTALFNAFIHESRQNFETAFKLIAESNTTINYQHSCTGINLLMIGAVHGYVEVVESLLHYGADTNLRAKKKLWTAIDFALDQEQHETIKILNSFMRKTPVVFKMDEGHLDQSKIYSMCTSSNSEVDLNLIFSIVKYICNLPETEELSTNNAILIFLPGCNEISILWSMLNKEPDLSVICLHSRLVECTDSFFKSPPSGTRKVILSTNIAEASITINDVSYVIDSGKIKDFSHEKNQWISKKSAIHRRGRAGHARPGMVFCTYTSQMYESLNENLTPEITRRSLVEICLQCKLLAPSNTSIVEFLAKCPEPPPVSSTRFAVHALREMEALNPSNEDVTELGSHLLDLPIDPHLGKMLLYAITLKCLDPVLTLVCCVSLPEPFSLVLNTNIVDQKVKKIRSEYAEGTFSDHMIRLRIFQAWQKATEEGNEEEFCKENNISSSVMNTITGLRSQLLGHLRASGFVRPRGTGDIKSLNQYSDNWAVVKGALLAGYYPNLARYDKKALRLKTAKEKKVNIHPSCVLSQSVKLKLSTSSEVTKSAMSSLSTEWLMFDDMDHLCHVPMVKCVTPISPITVLLFAGPNRLSSENISDSNMFLDYSSDSDSEDGSHLDPSYSSILKLDDWTAFHSHGPLINLALNLRQKLSAIFLRRLQYPKKTMSQSDDFVIKICVEVLAREDAVLNLVHPTDIGQRPRAIDAFRKSFIGCNNSDVVEENSSEDSQGASFNRFANPFVLRSFKFFIIKATCAQAIEISLYRGVWQFGNQTEKKLLKAVKQGFNPVIIFSIHGSGHFQGFAKFTGQSSKQHIPELVSQSSGSGSGTQYLIQWTRFSPLPFSATRHLINPYNKRQVHSSRDGQEIEPSIGDSLCGLWDPQSPHHRRKTSSFFGNGNNTNSASTQRGVDPSVSPSVLNRKSYVRY